MSPERVAISYGGCELAYGELNRRANQLAHALHAHGVGADVLVGLQFPAGPEMIIGMLAILKAGGGYLPLDPEQPRERLTQILGKAKPVLILTENQSVEPRGTAHRECLANLRAIIRRSHVHFRLTPGAAASVHAAARGEAADGAPKASTPHA